MPTAYVKTSRPITTTVVQKKSSDVILIPKENPAVVIQPTKEQKVDSLHVRGIPGRDGKTILTNSGPPAPGLGQDGDYYIDRLTYTIYGPKVLGEWGEGIPLITAGKNLIIKAAEQLTAYKVVTTNEFGVLVHASADKTQHADKVVGIVLNSPTPNNTGTVATEGEIINPGWNFIPEKAIFLGIDGEITQEPTPVGAKFSQQLGYAKGINTIMLKLGLAIILLD